jgi:Bcr/CflA subfamily drug resistance transporter
MTQYSKSLLFPLLLVIYEITIYLSNDMYLPALPEMMRDLNLTTHQAQLTLTTWFLGAASLPLFIGAISDCYGRRPVLLVGGLIYIIATIMCAVITQLSGLLIGRFIEGGMVATMMVAGYASIHELYDTKEAIRILAIMGGISVLAPALGPLLGALVLYFTNWQGIFWIIACLASLIVLLLYYWMPETLAREKQQKVILGQLIKRYVRLLTNKNFMLSILILGFIYCGFLSWVTAAPLLIIESFHHQAIVFGVIQAFVFGAYILGAFGVKYLLNVFEPKWLIRLGLIIILCGSSIMIYNAIYYPRALSIFLLAMVIYSFGSGICFSSLNRTTIEASTEPMGVRVALFSVFITSFSALGSVFSSIFFDGSLLSLAWIITLPCIFACVLQILLLLC